MNVLAINLDRIHGLIWPSQDPGGPGNSLNEVEFSAPEDANDVSFNCLSASSGLIVGTSCWVVGELVLLRRRKDRCNFGPQGGTLNGSNQSMILIQTLESTLDDSVTPLEEESIISKEQPLPNTLLSTFIHCVFIPQRNILFVLSVLDKRPVLHFECMQYLKPKNVKLFYSNSERGCGKKA